MSLAERALNNAAIRESNKITTPRWMLDGLEHMMQFYTKRHLCLDTQACDAFPAPMPGRKYMLYMHVPFCHTLCSFCTFHRFLFKEEKARAYFVSLRKEMEMAKALGYDFEELYIGGGTTTVLVDELARTIEHARNLFPGIKQVSCESDPLHLTSAEFTQLHGLVDRLSVGVQSFDRDILARTDRLEKFGEPEVVYEKLLRAKDNFPILNVDMIFGFQGQTAEVLQKDMDMLTRLGPRQITTYPLMVTHQTRKSAKGNLAAANQDIRKDYELILNTLKGHYDQLTAWSFGKSNEEGFDEYVVNYDDYLGLGSGSFSFLHDTLYVNSFSLRRYQERIAAGKMGVESSKHYTRHAVMQYRFLLNLFGGRLSKSYFKEQFGVSPYLGLAKEMAFMHATGSLKQDPQDPDKLQATPNGLMMGLLMMKNFYAGMDNVRAELRRPLGAKDM
ncbi:coproporphyrinogen III oxidase family protein [Ferrimonas balearica]|uniref:coproporphyrinogen III oxidase family protein n=1 Tax=Ferrimonas balearica TaxID=44012 RepID=UPI001C995980|nr:coproporphyrinogen III oxidase family protein [Ferrimonas balearica]MBY5922733.1 coproporphyrinogen III oxidase family protein [Ferrimonas balearica]MBY5995717.1 coproporphyrinogen III oxidase family protein [Ferrimonas balearica]